MTYPPRTLGSAAAGGPPGPLAIAGFVLRHRWLILGLPTVVFVTAYALAVALGGGYVSRSRFVPQPRDGGVAPITALAAQFSLLLGGQGGSESVEFYAELLRSREMLTQAVLSRYVVPSAEAEGDSATGTLVDLWRVGGYDDEARVRAAVSRLDRRLTIRTSREANSVAVTVGAESPSLAVQINARLLELVGEFNKQKRRSRATAERAFAEERLGAAQAELEEAEAEHRRFLERNREYQAAPHLRFEEARLERRVALRQQVYQALAEGYERARIEEVRDTPVITVVERPQFTVARAGGHFRDSVVWAFAAGLLGLGIAVTLDYLRRERDAGGPEYHAFVAVTARTPLARVGRRFLGGSGSPPSG